MRSTTLDIIRLIQREIAAAGVDLNPAEQQENQQHHDDQADAARRPIPPSGRVWPRRVRERAEQK